jgi:hypothetical protein
MNDCQTTYLTKLKGKKHWLCVVVTCSQIWLIPLVDDRQTTYLTKLGKKKHA